MYVLSPTSTQTLMQNNSIPLMHTRAHTLAALVLGAAEGVVEEPKDPPVTHGQRQHRGHEVEVGPDPVPFWASPVRDQDTRPLPRAPVLRVLVSPQVRLRLVRQRNVLRRGAPHLAAPQQRET